MMNVNEFVVCIKEDFPAMKISQDDLDHPSRDFAIQYYCTLIENITRVKMSQFLRVTEDELMYIKSSAGSITPVQAGTLKLFKTIKYIFTQIQCAKEFRYSDLVVPFLAPQRSQVFMMYLYSCYSICSEFDTKFMEYDKTKENQGIVENLKQRLATARELLAQKQEKKLNMHERSEQIKLELSELAVANEEREVAIKKLQEDKDEHVMQRQRLAEKEQDLQDKFKKAENDQKYYESLVVADPDQLLTTHKNLVRKKEECKLSLQALETQVAEKSTKVSHFDAVHSRYNSLSEVLRDEVNVGGKLMDYKGLYVALTETQKEIQQLEKEEAKYLADLKTAEESKGALNRNLTQKTEEQHRISVSRNESIKRFDEKVNELKRLCSELAHKAQTDEVSLRELARQQQVLRENITEIKNEIKASDVDHSTRYRKFKADLVECFVSVAKRMDEYIDDKQ